MNSRIGIIATISAYGMLVTNEAYGAVSRQGSDMADDTVSIREVAVVGHRPSHSVLSSLPEQSFQHDEMQLLGITDMADALRRMAGTNIKDYGGLGGMKTVSVHNMGAAHTAVSLDGLPVSNCQAGQIDVGRFDLRHMQSVTLAVGHQEDMLQSARLFVSGAVLSLQSLQPTFLADRQWSVNASCRVGEWGEVNPDIFYQQKVGDGTLLSANLNFLRADGQYPFTLSIPRQPTTTEHRSNNDIRQWHGELNLKHTLRNGGQLEVKAYGYDSERGLPGHVIYYNVGNNKERLWDQNAFLQARYKQQLNQRWSLLAQAKYNYAWDKYRTEGLQYKEGYAIEDNVQREGFLSLAALCRMSSRWSLSLAQDAFLNTLRSNMNFCPNPDRFSSFTALNLRYETARWRVTGTFVNTYITEQAEKGGNPADIEHLSPSVALRYLPLETEPLYLRLMYKNTFRTPNFNDLYYRNLGNLKLNPEDAQELSTGITYAPRLVGPFRNTAITADGYWSTIKNKIVAIPTSYVWSMRNFGEARMWGIDATLKTTLPLCDTHKAGDDKHKAGDETHKTGGFTHKVTSSQEQGISLDLQASYSWMRAINLTDPNGKSYKHQLPYTPWHSGNASLLLRTPWVNVGYSVMVIGKRYMSEQNIEANEMKAFQDHTITLSRRFDFRACQVHAIVSVSNLWNEQYDIIRNYPMPGRAFHATLEVKF